MSVKLSKIDLFVVILGQAYRYLLSISVTQVSCERMYVKYLEKRPKLWNSPHFPVGPCFRKSNIELIITCNVIASLPLLTPECGKLSEKQFLFSHKNNTFTAPLTSVSNFRIYS